MYPRFINRPGKNETYAYINQDFHLNLLMYVQLILARRRQHSKAQKYI